MAGKPPRNKLDWLDWEEARRREESAWTLERMWSKASMWSLRAKAMMGKGKPKITEIKDVCQERKVKKLKAQKGSNSGGIQHRTT